MPSISSGRDRRRASANGRIVRVAQLEPAETVRAGPATRLLR